MKQLAWCLALAACAGTAAPPAMPLAMQLPGDMPDALREAIIDDAARRAGVSRESLRVVTAQAVTWRDGALGCPQPGRVYTQALVPGWRLEIAAAQGAPLLYHASRRGGWTWCARERAQEPLPGSADPRI